MKSEFFKDLISEYIYSPDESEDLTLDLPKIGDYILIETSSEIEDNKLVYFHIQIRYDENFYLKLNERLNSYPNEYFSNLKGHIIKSTSRDEYLNFKILDCIVCSH